MKYTGDFVWGSSTSGLAESCIRLSGSSLCLRDDIYWIESGLYWSPQNEAKPDFCIFVSKGSIGGGEEKRL